MKVGASAQTKLGSMPTNGTETIGIADARVSKA
jgi:hypothetical protein